MYQGYEILSDESHDYFLIFYDGPWNGLRSLKNDLKVGQSPSHIFAIAMIRREVTISRAARRRRAVDVQDADLLRAATMGASLWDAGPPRPGRYDMLGAAFSDR
jgi:hypothetical protein